MKLWLPSYQIMHLETSLELINFNPLAESKYHTMDRDYQVLKGLAPLTEEELDELYSILERYELNPVREKKI